jgi:hypothetical protein
MTTKQLAGTMVHELFESHIYLICDRTFECVLCTHKAESVVALVVLSKHSKGYIRML